jgi:multiple sugar transport system permease protein
VKLSDEHVAWVYMVPTLAILGLFTVYPFVYMAVSSTFAAMMGPTPWKFVGFGNFARFLSDPIAIQALGNTIIFMILSPVITVLLGLGIGLLLNIDFKYATFVRAIVLVPWILSEIDIALLWKWMLDSAQGLLNWLLIWSGIIPSGGGIAFLGLPSTALPTTAFVMAWRLCPLLSLMVVASLHAVNIDLYEAASLDGAGTWAKFKYISFEALRYPLVIGGLLTAVWSGNDFAMVYMMTGGGPIHYTELLTTYVYKTTWSFMDIGYGSTIGLINFSVLVVFSAVFLVAFRKYWSE